MTKFCKINLLATNYSLLSNAKMLNEEKINISVFNTIYKKYCTHKKFDSVMTSKKRILCAPPAPPEGLYLKRVIY